MKKIKKFFKGKAAEKKSETAGSAHKLDKSATSSKRESSCQIEKYSHQQLFREPECAAAAALERIEQQKQPNLNWTSWAIKNQAKRELELENSLKEKAVSQPSEIIQVEQDCPTFAVSGVFYTCPIIGPEILPKDAVKNKIRSYLYEQLEQERGLTASLMIHTLNKNKSKVQKGVETLSRYLTNIIDKPTEEKYRRIRLKNRAFQERIVDLEGAFDFLIAAGFTQEKLTLDENEEEYFVLQDGNLTIEKLQILQETLSSAKPILSVLHRDLKVSKPAEFIERVDLPQDFCRLTLDEVKRKQEMWYGTSETENYLRTKAMREKEEIRRLQMIYKYTLIRIRFPDGVILQGTFSVYEKLSTVREFVAENLADPCLEFDLLLPEGMKITDEGQSLLESMLVPDVVLNFRVSDETSLSGSAFLNSDCMALLSDL